MDYRARYLVFFVLCLILSEYEANDEYQGATKLSRKRRYVVFPEGSTFSVSIARHIATLVLAKSPFIRAKDTSLPREKSVACVSPVIASSRWERFLSRDNY